MSVNIRFPNITASTDAGKLRQLQGYMHQLVEQLNWALNTLGAAPGASGDAPVTATPGKAADDPVATFQRVKGLIIKSADIVRAYYQQIDSLLKLSGEYVAEAAFPEGSATFVEQTGMQLSANAQSIRQAFQNIQKLQTDLERSSIRADAHINAGLLDYDGSGAPVFGLEIGQRTEVDGVETFRKYARFTPDRLAFFDRNGYEVAYISDRKLHITEVEITAGEIMGGFQKTVVPGVGVVTRWIGG